MKKRDQKQNRKPFAARRSSWLIVLVAGMLAVVFLPRIIILGKYTSDLFDYTGVVADDFHFTSDYMSNAGSNTKMQIISGWQGDPAVTRVELRNFENSLRYNDADTDTWYYFTVKVECGEDAVAGTKLEKNGEAKYTISVETKSTAASAGSSTSSASSGSSTKTLPLYCYYNPADGKTYPCQCIKGHALNSFRRTEGTHYITINVTDFGDNNKAKDQRVTIEAHTITADELKNIKSRTYTNSESKAWNSDTPLEGTSADGVYKVDLNGMVIYQHSEDVQEVKAIFEGAGDATRQHYYNLICQSVSGTSTRYVTVYYDPEYVDFSNSQSLIKNYVPASGEDAGYSKYKYFRAEIQTNCKTELSCLTPWNGTGTATLGDGAISERIAKAPAERKSSMAGGYVLWFEVEGQDAPPAEPIKTIQWASSHIENVDGTAVSDMETAGFVLKNADTETEGTRMNRIRFKLAEAGTITVGIVDADMKTVIDSEVINVTGSAGDTVELSTSKTYTLAEGQRFFIGAPADTAKFRYSGEDNTMEDEVMRADFYTFTGRGAEHYEIVAPAEEPEFTIGVTVKFNLGVDFGYFDDTEE